MLAFDIPGFGPLRLEHLVTDFTGTLSVDGALLPGVAALLSDIGKQLNIHVLTADTTGKVHTALAGVNCRLTVLSGNDLDRRKKEYLQSLGPETVIAVGNGMNDHLMLKEARLGIAVIEGEGCATRALLNADIAVRNICEALEMVLNPLRCVATLRV
ncbi:HAD family hydrolase [Trichlorobacter lovleyi]|uniref:HAD family hydrolase n=1 Tax=Trichlorobacter lovleyi TaxID=313985 RepID=UPI0023F0956F|nr:ATPase P [Trichlorobacter lovleyi]